MINKKYTAKLKYRMICFHLKDKEIYELSKRINFQKFVKDKLRELLKEKENEKI